MRVVVGRVGRPHGIRGEVTVEPRTDEPDERFAPGAVLQVDGPVHQLVVERTHWHSGRLLVVFEGVADRIEYNSQADTVKFIGRAVLRRYRGSNLNDETAGNTIVYDNGADVFTVDGGTATTAATPNNPGGRVRAMLTPVPKADASATAPANSPAPVLKPSPSMGPGKQ